MRWRARAASSRAKERANISFFIFIIFFAVFGIIILTELLLLERPQPSRSHYEDLQYWAAKTDKLSSEVIEPAPPAQSPLDGVWQPVAGTRFRFFVYSAWVEKRTVAAVRVIAATKTRGPDAVVCRLWLPDNRTLTLKAKVQTIRENWNMKYSAVYVLCLLRDTGVKPLDTIGASIAVLASTAVNRPTTNLLTVMNTDPKTENQKSLHVCVKPLHFSYHRDEWLVEWIEMNRLLGVSHFYMFNSNISQKVDCILNRYQRQGLVTLLPWKLPIQSQVEIRTEGQFAAFNDCLYRSMANAGWLMIIDTDELVFPRRAQTIPAMLSVLSAAHNPPSRTPAAFLFRNAFFYTRWEDDPESPAPLLTSRKTRRLVTPHALKNRSKYVVRPRYVVELGNHFVWEHGPGTMSVGVSVENALLHHYRVNCEFDGVQCLQLHSTIDRTAHLWTKKLWEKVQEEQKEIVKVCGVKRQRKCIKTKNCSEMRHGHAVAVGDTPLPLFDQPYTSGAGAGK